jgi:antitoxin MazE
MRVAKWGNSLALRLPAKLVKELQLVEGDEVEVRPVDAQTLEIARDEGRVRALEQIRRIRRLSRPLPPDYRFDRDEANER